MNTDGSSPTQQTWPRRAAVALAALYVAGMAAYFILGYAGQFERDGYFHARFASLLPQFGLSRTFPWTQASVWNGEFCDKEFLFHLLMCPFTQVEPAIAGAGVYAVLLAFGLYAALYLVLRGQNVRGALIFALLPMALGGLFLLRSLMIRSHILSMILAVVAMHFLMRKHWKALAILGFVYAWSYTFPMVLAMFAVPYVAGQWLAGDRLDWKSVVACVSGVVLGLAIHPYSPLTLDTFLIYLKVLATGANMGDAQLELGQEIYAYPTRKLLYLMPLYHVVWVGLLVLGWRCGRRAQPQTLGALSVALFWWALTLWYGRFVEYGVPLLALATGLIARDLTEGQPWRELLPDFPRAKLGAAAAAVLLFLAGHAHALYFTHHHYALADPPRFTGAAEWMTRNLDEGETVVHLWWDEFPDLYYAAPRQHFLWGLDPIYTHRFNPDLAQRLEAIRTHRAPVEPAWLAETFQARILVMGHAQALGFPAFVTGRWNPIYVDRFSVVFALTGPQGPPPDFRDTGGFERPPSAFGPTDMPLAPRK